MGNGERLKIFSNSSLAWAVVYGSAGNSMALSPDSSFLIAGAKINLNVSIGKLNSSTGEALASYSTADSGFYAFTQMAGFN